MTHRLSLTSEEIGSLKEAMRRLLAPHEYETMECWRRAAAAAVETLARADMVAHVHLDGVQPAMVTSVEAPGINTYLAESASHDRQLRLWKRQASQVVWSRRTLWGEHLRAMRASAYYNEWVRPNRFFDTIGLTVEEGGVTSSLHLTHQSERGVRFGERGMMLLSLLEPSFRMGLQLAAAHFSPTQSVARPSTAMQSLLTPREQDVARLLSRRRSNREIAEALGMSRSTAKRHTENILAKLNLRSRREIESIIG